MSKSSDNQCQFRIIDRKTGSRRRCRRVIATEAPMVTNGGNMIQTYVPCCTPCAKAVRKTILTSWRNQALVWALQFKQEGA